MAMDPTATVSIHQRWWWQQDKSGKKNTSIYIYLQSQLLCLVGKSTHTGAFIYLFILRWGGGARWEYAVVDAKQVKFVWPSSSSRPPTTYLQPTLDVCVVSRAHPLGLVALQLQMQFFFCFIPTHSSPKKWSEKPTSITVPTTTFYAIHNGILLLRWYIREDTLKWIKNTGLETLLINSKNLSNHFCKK